MFVKPARGGSRIGISKVHDAGELADAIEEAHRHDPKVLVEVAAEGAREVECGVLQALDGTPETSLPAEIRITGDHEFYDFAAKYLPEEHTELDVPADLPDDVATDAARRWRRGPSRRSAARAWPASTSSCCPDGSLVVNEINTMPGFTPLSMFPRMWAATGPRLPGPGRPADHAGAHPLDRPALSRAERLLAVVDQLEVVLDRLRQLGDDGGAALGAVVVRHLDRDDRAGSRRP